MSKSLTERIGGKDTVKLAIDLFYQKISADKRINHLFDTFDEETLKFHQNIFIPYILDDPKNLRKRMKEIPAFFDLKKIHFTAIMENLQSTLEEINLPNDLIEEVLAIANSARN